MKIIAMLLTAAFLAATPAQAGSYESRLSEAQVEELLQRAEDVRGRLNLTPEQEAQVTPILEESREQRIDVLNAYGFGDGARPSLNFREKRKLGKEMKGIRQDTEKKLAGILGPEQMAEFEKIQDEMREKLRDRIK